MIPVKQTVFGDGSDGSEPGNCFAACLASILEFPIDLVPNFMAEHRPPPEDADLATTKVWHAAFMKGVNDYLSPSDLWYFELHYPEGMPRDVAEMAFCPRGYWIGMGPCWGSPHCVVMLGLDLAFNPHVPRVPLDRIETIGILAKGRR